MDSQTIPPAGAAVPPPAPKMIKNVGMPPVPGTSLVAGTSPVPGAPVGKAGGPPPVAAKAAGPAGPAQISGLLPGEEPQNPDEQEQFHHASGFFNQPWVQNLMPFATSLVFHVTIICLGIFLFHELPKLASPNKEQTIIPNTQQLGQAKMPGGTLHPGPLNDPSRDLMQNETQDVKTDDGLDTHPSDNLNGAAGGGGGENSNDFLGSNAKGGSGHSSGGGKGDGFGSGSGGSPAPYGTPGGGDGHTGPKSSIYGTGGNADKVVFLVDTSGSMIGVFGDVRANLKKTVMQLPCDVRQGCVSFDIITFSDEKEPRIFSKTINGGKAQLMPANEDIKKKAADFIDDQVASGGTLPMPAIHAAFNYSPKPQLVYVMTDGFDNVASFDEVINAFKEGTKDGMTKVNCIHFVAEPDPKLVQVLEQISTDGHGEFKQIQKSDMQ